MKGSERIAGDLAVVMQKTDTRGTYKGTAVRLIGAETAVQKKKGGLGDHALPPVLPQGEMTGNTVPGTSRMGTACAAVATLR
jgi:hypothetical protein